MGTKKVWGSSELVKLLSEKKDIWIYGAESLALRVWSFLENNQIHIKAFAVSEKYNNPDSLAGKEVIRIEQNPAKTIDTMIVAVSDKYTWDVEALLRQYHVKEIIILDEYMINHLPGIKVMLGNETIAENVYISDKAQIVVDDTSALIIEEGAVIDSDVLVLVTNNSVLEVKRNVRIGYGSKIVVNNHAICELGEDSLMRNETRVEARTKSIIRVNKSVSLQSCMLVAKDEGKIFVGDKVSFDDSTITAEKQGIINIQEECIIAKGGMVSSTLGGVIWIGNGTTIGLRSIIATCGSEINLGEDNMISFDVKIVVGYHEIADIFGKIITNYTSIRTEKHVWIGMGSTLLPGADILEGSVIGANTIVNHRIVERTVCVGVDAETVRKDVNWDRKNSS